MAAEHGLFNCIRQVAPILRHGFLAPRKSAQPNGMSIGSAALARLDHGLSIMSTDRHIDHAASRHEGITRICALHAMWANKSLNAFDYQQQQQESCAIAKMTTRCALSEILPLLCSSTPLFPTPPLVSQNVL